MKQGCFILQLAMVLAQPVLIVNRMCLKHTAPELHLEVTLEKERMQ